MLDIFDTYMNRSFVSFVFETTDDNSNNNEQEYEHTNHYTNYTTGGQWTWKTENMPPVNKHKIPVGPNNIDNKAMDANTTKNMTPFAKEVINSH